ncbi:hypothetical protein [Amphibacillus cookii]|uniref:hypothetical protein n=1 Tax=Amphibacillus cookii TaxID=767787 RepID=UPI00195E8BEB|nr:hypothetical protein [Amphibacillus cookii]MBM7541042.1 hypothetical protein [Amphibacillus cookii]
MNPYQYSGVQLLLLDHSDQTVQMRYNDNPYTWPMRLIGRRPPYYTNPRYIQTFPVI